MCRLKFFVLNIRHLKTADIKGCAERHLMYRLFIPIAIA